jgi:N4-gp56 family major capsid protein
MPTSIPVGSALARKAYSVGLFNRVQTAPGFMNMLSGEMPQAGSFAAKTKGQTSPDMPIVKTGELQKGAGDAISIDLFNILQGKPVMGDRKIAGKLMSLTNASMDIKIQQYRGGADSGGRMSQQRTVHNLRNIAMESLNSWMCRLEDQVSLVHLAGARGSQATTDWVVPLTTDGDFADILVNTLKAPTKNRQFYAADATSGADLATTDPLTLQDVERIAATVRESEAPLQGIKVPGDLRAWGEPLWVLYVTERQWLYMRARTSDKMWREAAQNAYERKSPGVKHPLFDNFETIMWGGILIKRMPRYAIRFAAGDTIVTDTGGTDGKTYTESNVTAAVATDRAILLGAQALGKAFGKNQKSEYFYDWSEEETDHGNAIEIVGAGMGGTAKVRFTIDGAGDTDMGVACIDSYAPAPNSAAGATLLAS